MSIMSLERNDLDGAVREYRHVVQTAVAYQEVEDAARTLVMLQDDPDELLERLDSIASEARVSGRLRQLRHDADLALAR